MSPRGRLWHVLNVGLQATTTPTDGVGDKRTLDELEDGVAQETPPVEDSEASEASEASESSEASGEIPGLSQEDSNLLSTSMRMKIALASIWKPEHRNLWDNSMYDNVPLVQDNRDWDIPEFRVSSQVGEFEVGEVEVTGTLDQIIMNLRDGTPDRPPAFKAEHFSIHLAACQAALFKRPELLENVDTKFHQYIRGDGESKSILSLVFVYNAVSEDSEHVPLVAASDLEAMGLSDLEIYRFWHQLRSLLSDIMECTAVSGEVSGEGESVEVADFVSRMLVDLDPRSLKMTRGAHGAQAMDW